ncbi:hypothetical protein FHS18_000159 [Paenibacillus phyllosphaerae]|uniref:UDP-glucuronosyltransferase n=1 Tax=Paenibacillus phyllosphaerae TaxID=274593 RepID=A0A7W5FKH4_9BACL|nr:UDP-glucuronosyltransferase [Paenibacillus phyllosphaerae]MBB3108131.1 hypothetical protein [Paenibacillus phyllosphaerae]
MQKKLYVLCSGFGLGFYNPGLLLCAQLERRGISAEALVFESCLRNDKIDGIGSTRSAYHHNFQAALVGAKMPIDTRNSLDEDKVEQLLAEWERGGAGNFVLLSGNWVYLIDLYKQRAKVPVQADILYVDSDYAPSFASLRKFVPDYETGYRELWPFNSRTSEITAYLPVSEDPAIPFAQRESRYVVHGGGWGMGTYQHTIPELEARGLLLDIVAYEWGETRRSGSAASRYYMNDPNWHTWDTDAEGKHTFPPFSQIIDGEAVGFAIHPDRHGLYDVIRRAKGIVSKPGAGTLIDSLASATPIIMLDAFGKHEQKNADLWMKHGLGIRYADWLSSGCNESLLDLPHANLLKKKAECANLTDLVAELHVSGILKRT